MISKIKRIKNLGLVFFDYVWDSSLPDFKRFNLIYGWTGSGKTTLSNIFTTLENGVSSKYPNLEYEIETEAENYRQGQSFNKKVRVFNEEYISKNVKLLEGVASPIFILGEENQKLIEAIRKDESLLASKVKKKKAVFENKETTEAAKAKQFTDIARIISSNTSGEATRKYDKRNAEDAFVKLKAKKILAETKIREHSLALKQIKRPLMGELEIKKIKDEQKNKEVACFDSLSIALKRGKELSIKTAESVVIERLKAHSDISEWTETGVALHDRHNSTKCEFCGLDLPKSRITALAQHFSEADKIIKDDIDALVLQLDHVYSCVESTNAIDKANLYGELQLPYQDNVEMFENSKKLVLKGIAEFTASLKEKKTKTAESVALSENINVQPLSVSIEKVNVEIKRHNHKTNNFKTEIDNAQKELEKHYLSTIYDEVKQTERKIKDFEIEIGNLDNGNPAIMDDVAMNDLENRIDKNKSKISSPKKACTEINEKLEKFLGRKEITFEVKEEGYSIRRNGEAANHLSEGEKTAIAFVYFVVHLGDRDFDITNGIVIIDDPVSSLDSNSLFQAFAFLQTAISEVHQFFILTHNFDFLRLVLNWLQHPKIKSNSGFYMLKNDFLEDRRMVNICRLDKDLQDHESEYHYLFKLLYTFKSDGTIARAYPIPNIARKVLETFLMFRVPNSKSIYEKLASLKEFDLDKRTAIYKFTNNQSHITGKGFSPSLVPETQKNVTYLLEMIKATFPKHYEVLVEPLIEADP